MNLPEFCVYTAYAISPKAELRKPAGPNGKEPSLARCNIHLVQSSYAMGSQVEITPDKKSLHAPPLVSSLAFPVAIFYFINMSIRLSLAS